VLIFSVIAYALIGAPSRPISGAAMRQPPRYEAEDCAYFDIPADPTVECGFLTIPEDHRQPDGPTIKLAVAILKSVSAHPAPDPLLYLAGGPGISPLKQFSRLSRLLAPFRAERDVILLDQRGVGYSEPALDCWELTNLAYELLDQNPSYVERATRQLEAVAACHDRQIARGVNLAVYSTAQSASDVDALRVALGYEQWNLYGISYGTRLALFTMRDHPDGIRSVILDSVYPPQVDYYAESVPYAVAAFESLFARCAADPGCNAAYPDVESVLLTLLDNLRAEPVVVSVTHPATDRPQTVLIDDDALVTTLFARLYNAGDIPFVPFLIYEARNGTYDQIAKSKIESLVYGRPTVSYGAQFSFDCREEITFNDRQKTREVVAASSELGRLVWQSYGPIYEVCDLWNTAQAEPGDKAAARSDIPTLILAGEFDPVTPPAWAKLATETLSHSVYLQFPGVGHGVIRSDDCGLTIALDFINHPSANPDTSCLSGRGALSFFTPPESVDWMPFVNGADGIKGAAPEGWIEDSPGNYYWSAPIGRIGLMQRAGPYGSDAEVISELARVFGAETVETRGTREANGLVWALYAFNVNGRAFDIAIATRGAMAYIVALANDVGAYEVYRDVVFLPAVDALTPIE
jgi:pimeloyl-ACP methyl ester carboxylesterase